jgi:gamma-glutamyl-gamma-aminobutyrate hydrolase PuuD
MKKIIAIPGWSTGDQSFGVSKPYAEHLSRFGDIIILTPNSFVPNIDLLFLPGGKDVMHGGQGEFSFLNSDGERFLEHFDKYTLPKYIEEGTPIFGTCRGFQTLLRHFNVPLIQNIYWEHAEDDRKTGYQTHKVTLSEYGSEILYNYSGKRTTKIEIGSWHHQGAYSRDVVNSNLHSLGQTDDEVCEFFIHPERPIAGAQGHVERDENYMATGLIELLLNTKK